MTGAVFEVLFDDRQILGALDRVEAGLAAKGGLLEQLGEYGVVSTQRRWDTQAGPDGTAWPGLSTAYASLKPAGLGLLYLGGDLRNTQHFDVGPDVVRWGSGMVYAAVHQFGATITPKNAKALRFFTGLNGVREVFAKSVTIPARPFLGLSPVDAAEIVRIGTEYLRGFL